MAIRLLVPTIVIALAALAHAKEFKYLLDSELEMLNKYDDEPLKCYSKNNVTGAVALEVCSRGKPFIVSNAEYPYIQQFPYCSMFKFQGRMLQTCMYSPAIAMSHCAKTCIEHHPQVNQEVSECCCTTSGCNGHMLPRAVLELPDEE